MKLKLSPFSQTVSELLSVVAIPVILALPGVSILWVMVPVGLFLILKMLGYKNSIDEKYLRVKVQLDQMVRLLPEPISDLRCTYYVPKGRNVLLQTCDYIPNGGGKGRELQKSKGIVGKAFTDKERKVENFTDADEYRSRMLEEYNFTAEDLRSITPDRRSYFCYPLTDPELDVLGLVYLDCPMPNTFVLNPGNVTEIISKCCSIIEDSLL